MPQTQNFDGTVRDLKPGDGMITVNDVKAGKSVADTQPTVVRVDRKVKNAIIETDRGDIVAPLTAFAAWTREVPTAEEKAAKEAEDLKHYRARAVDKWVAWADVDPAAHFNEKMSDYAPSRFGDGLTWAVEGTMELSAKRAIGDNVKRLVDSGKYATDEVFVIVVEQLQRDVFQSARWRESSTSTVHNLNGRVVLSVKADVLDDFYVKIGRKDVEIQDR